MQFALKITGKLGPLKVPAKLVDGVLDSLEKVAVQVRNKARDMETKIKNGGYIEKLKSAESKLKTAEDRLKVAEYKIDAYAGSTAAIVVAIDQVDPLLAQFEEDANAAATPMNDVLVPINQLYNDIEEDLQFIDDAFNPSGAAGLFDALTSVASQFDGINEALKDLSGPLQAVQKALAPVEWLLDAIGFIYNITVGPVIDFLLDKLGVTAIFTAIGNEIKKLLPEINVLDEMAAKITGVFEDLQEFISGFETDIDKFIGDITNDVENALDAVAPDAIRYGTDESEAIYGRTNGLDILNGLGGDDTLYGYAENDTAGAATTGDCSSPARAMTLSMVGREMISSFCAANFPTSASCSSRRPHPLFSRTCKAVGVRKPLWVSRILYLTTGFIHLRNCKLQVRFLKAQHRPTN